MNTRALAVFDPAMCCSTGVCGTDVDPELVRFAADLAWLSEQGIEVRRFNLAQEPGAFVAERTVRDALEADGDAALPMLVMGGRAVMSGAYPTRDQLAGWFGLAAGARRTTTSCCSPKSGCC